GLVNPPPESITETALYLRNQLGSKRASFLQCARLVRHNDSYDGCCRAVLQQGITGEQDLAPIFAGDDPVFGLIPVQNQHSFPFAADRVLVYFEVPSVYRDFRASIIPDLPTAARQTMLRRVH